MPHLFLVEDEATDIELIRRSLERCHAPVFVHKFNRGKDAISFLETQGTPFDVAIVDLNLPDMPGIAVIRALRNHVCGRETSILAVSGSGDSKLQEEALNSGATRFVYKGWDSEEFEKALIAAVNHYVA